MKVKYVIYTFLLLIVIGCSDVKLPQSEPQLAIDGWIETGKGPVVMVTVTVPVDQEIGSEEDLKSHVVIWGKVTVSDGERDVILTGMKNDDYYPPYIYTTSSMRGEAGKTYSIKVEYGGRTATAVTSVPEEVPIGDLKVRKSNDGSGYYITAILKDDPYAKNYYKVFVRRSGKDSIYVPSFLGLINDEVLSDGADEILINNAIDNMEQSAGTYFSDDDDVFIRFSSIDEAAYHYWSDFDGITMSRNPLFPVTSRIRSNITGGLGHWSGYGSSYYRVSIADSLALGRIY